MTSVVDMRYTLLAPPTVLHDSGNESCSSAECFTPVKLENDPILGFDFGFANNEMKKLENELSKYEVTEMTAENDSLLGDMPMFPELSFDSEDLSSSDSELFSMDSDSLYGSISTFDCCCSEQCRSYDSASDWSYQSSPRSFGNCSDDDKMSPLTPYEPQTLYLDRRKDMEYLLDKKSNIDLKIKLENMNYKSKNIEWVNNNCWPANVKIKKEEMEETESITPSPMHTEDEEDNSDCPCDYISNLSNVAQVTSSNLQETTRKRRRLNSLCSDSDQSEDFQKESSHKKRLGKLDNRPEHGTKHGNYKPRQLYQFLMDLLHSGKYSPEYIEWVSRDEKVFRLVDSAGVARMWGECKNRENMTYEKMSRALRYYYENGILERVPNCRLHYRFGKTAYEEYASTWDEIN